MTKDPKRKWSAKRGQGEAAAWLKANIGYDRYGCLLWPFSKMPTGYGCLGHLGKSHYAHRFMCELVNGPAPTPKHYASHSCGNGHLGCVHPRHLSWKTPYENAIDRLTHGNNKKKGDPRWKLNKEQASEIRALKGQVTQYELAALYGVSRETISHIHCGRLWPAKS